MNTPLTPSPALDPADDVLVARLRAALDEVAATRSGEAGPLIGSDPAGADRSTPGRGWSAGRWAAIAASVALFAGAAVAVGTNLGHRGPEASNGSDGSGAVDTDAAVDATVGDGADPLMPYTLIVPDLAPGEVLTAVGGTLRPEEVAAAWALGGDPAAGLLMVRSAPLYSDYAPATSPSATAVIIGGEVSLIVDSYGLTAAQRDELAAAITPGSGVPWLLPVDGWTSLGFSTADDPAPRRQTFGGTVALTAGAPLDVLFNFATAPDVRSTTVAGEPGWVLTYASAGDTTDTPLAEGQPGSALDGAGGFTQVLWRHPATGQWMQLDIPLAMADRVDELIAAVAVNGAVDDTTVPAAAPNDTAPAAYTGHSVTEVDASAALPPFDLAATSDPAIGTPTPAVVTTDGPFQVDGPTLLVFVAHWCPHCNAELPVLIDGMADGALDGVRVVVVSTADLSSGVNFPAAEWLATVGWTGEVLFDISAGDGSPGEMAAAYGATGWPYLVMLDANGLVTGRTAGETTLDGIQALTATATPAEVLGRLVIDAIDVDWLVGGDPNLDMRSGPVMAMADGVTVIFGNRTTYGAPFQRLDELQPGDTVTFQTLDGTRTFEVTLVETCPTGDTSTELAPCPTQAGDDLLLVTFDPEYTTNASLTVHATEVAA